MNDSDIAAWRMTHEEACCAFVAIALSRFSGKCECEHDVGYICRRCQRDAVRVARQPERDPMQREHDAAYRWARMMVKHRRVEVTQ